MKLSPGGSCKCENRKLIQGIDRRIVQEKQLFLRQDLGHCKFFAQFVNFYRKVYDARLEFEIELGFFIKKGNF